MFSFYIHVDLQKTAFEGEVMGISVTLRQLNSQHFCSDRVVILSDSRAALQAIGSSPCPISEEILEFQILLEKLRLEGKNNVLQWIPGHCGIYGNDQADKLAKNGTEIVQRTTTNCSFHFVKLFIRKQMKQKWREVLISNKSWRNILEREIADKSRDKALVKFRLEIGHDCLGSHLFRIGIFNSPNRPLCGTNEEMDRTYIRRCSVLRGSSKVKKY